MSQYSKNSSQNSTFLSIFLSFVVGRTRQILRRQKTREMEMVKNHAIFARFPTCFRSGISWEPFVTQKLNCFGLIKVQSIPYDRNFGHIRAHSITFSTLFTFGIALSSASEKGGKIQIGFIGN